ncbi:MAG TPA: preprotein translocase subunit SecY, partial [Bradyrhizobium sp.]|nr:preprotein translocase subunit SecY [Bradyrhizobium sp.]
MVSAAEQLAANLNFSALGKADELKKRIWFTLGALLVYRLGTYLPLPGIDPNIWEQVFRSQAGGILGMFNMFAGGGIHRMAIFALNIMPYISASIIIQLLTTVSPQLEALKKEGEAGRKALNQYTRYLTVILAAFQSYGIAVGLEGAGNVVSDPGLFFRLSTAITLTGGTMFLMWLGEQITSRGIGNGISLIILSGIVAELPSALASMLELGRQGALSTGLILVVIVMAVVVIAFIVFMERAQRRLLIQYPKRQVGNQMFEGQSSHLPLKLNTSGVIPPIFALNIMPYISASIIVQLMTTVSPTLAQLKKEGEQGRKTMNQYTRYLTVLLAGFQAYGISIGLEGATSVVTDPGWFFRIGTVITLTGGTMFLMWLGEQVTSRGIGNGISLIILSGIVAELPSALANMLELGRQGAMSTGLIIVILVMAVAVIAFIVFMERAQRRLLIQYPKRQVGNRMFEGQSS